MSSVAVSSAFKTSPFEFDALQAKKGVELWAIRVPADVSGCAWLCSSMKRVSRSALLGR